MKLCVKKVYCPDCQKMVKCREQKTNGNMNFVCPNCGGLLWTSDGIHWKYGKKNAAAK